MKLIYRKHDERRFRVWRQDWLGDQFEVLSKQDFETVKWVCNMFSISIEEAEDEYE